MLSILKKICFISFIFLSMQVAAAEKASVDNNVEQEVKTTIDSLEKPLYNPFVERYVLDYLKQLRMEMADQKAFFIQQIVDREHTSVDRAVTYATSTVTYFFYLIAGATSLFVLVGWSSLRDIKERVHSLADEEISKLVHHYEERLQAIEVQLKQRSQDIEENREDIELTQEVQGLWLKAARETNHNNKLVIFDQLLALRSDDTEALTYKADSVLELGEPQWAANLCRQALSIDPDDSHAFYQLACANAALGRLDDAVHYLEEAFDRTESYRIEVLQDKSLEPLIGYPPFEKLLADQESDHKTSA